MAFIRSHHDSPRRFQQRGLVGLILLIVLGTIANCLPLPLFFGVDFVFGNIAVMVILALYGLPSAVAAAVLINAQTWLLWGQPYSVLVWTGEVLCVGMLRRYWPKTNLCQLDAIFWIILGVPLGGVFYYKTLNLDVTSAVMIVLKQSINGLFCAVIAQLSLQWLPLNRWLLHDAKRSTFPLHQVVATLITAFMLIPTLVVTVINSRDRFADMERRTQQEIFDHTTAITSGVGSWLEANRQVVRELASSAAAGQSTAQLQALAEFGHASFPDLSVLLVTGPDGTSYAHAPLLDLNGLPALGRNYADRDYFAIAEATQQPWLGQVMLGRIIHQPIVPIVVPIVRQEQFNGVALGGLNPTHVRELLGRLSLDRDMKASLIDANDQVVASTRPGMIIGSEFARVRGGSLESMGDHNYRWLPNDATSKIDRWNRSAVVRRVAVGQGIPWTLEVEMPAAILRQDLMSTYTKNLAMMLLLTVAAAFMAQAVSVQVTVALSRLATLTGKLPQKVRTNEPVQWPETRIEEIDALAVGSSWMTASLQEQFLAVEQEAREQRALLATAMGAVDASVIITDATKCIVYVNEHFTQEYGYSTSETLGRHTSFLRGSFTDPAVITRLERALQQRERLAVDIINHRKDGTPVESELFLSPILDAAGNVTHFVGVLRDITARKAVERMKNEFVSTVSHELRTPLTSIRGSLGLLQQGVGNTSNPRVSQLLDIATSNTDRLIRLINDILDLERMESGHMEMRPEACATEQLVEQSIATVRTIAEQNQITLAVHAEPLSVWAVADKAVQVLVNLLSNAVKFSEPGTTVTLRVQRDGEYVRFAVTDQGRGIPPEFLHRIFDRFEQVDASDARQKGGTGLGLAIAKTIVDHMGGQIWVESHLGSDSTFFFTLPAADRAESDLDASAADYLPESGRILVCDDDPDITNLLHLILRPHGYAVTEVHSAEDAATALRSEPYDALLLDVLMPEKSGLELVSELKQDPALREVPVIMISAKAPADFEGNPLPPVLDWLNKPIDMIRLTDTVKRAVISRGQSHVLAVDDDPELLQLIVQQIEPLGVTVQTARSGREAVAMADRRPPALVILDLLMPDGDGFYVVDELRKHPQLRNVPLLMYTAKELTREDRAQLHLGITRYLTKAKVPESEFIHHVVSLLEGLRQTPGHM